MQLPLHCQYFIQAMLKLDSTQRETKHPWQHAYSKIVQLTYFRENEFKKLTTLNLRNACHTSVMKFLSSRHKKLLSFETLVLPVHCMAVKLGLPP
jgi:hypothetical protein